VDGRTGLATTTSSMAGWLQGSGERRGKAAL